MNFLSLVNPNELKNKTCLLRAGFNIENKDEIFRLERTLPTIKYLLKQNTKIVIFSHRGRPQKTVAIGEKIKASKDETLKITLPYLKKNLNCPIIFISDFDFENLKKKINRAKPKSIFIVENIRLLKGEEKNDSKLGEILSSIGDIYVNDDFAAAHRASSSITQIPKHLPSFAGFLMEIEIKSMDKILHNPKKPLVVIVGGAKVPEKISIIGKLLPIAKSFLIGGVVASTFLKAKNLDIGTSKFDESMIDAAKILLKSKKIILPADYVLHNDQILDIGPGTVKIFEEEIKNASTILWNGPLGFFEDKRYKKGSETVAKSVAQSKAFSLLGGGETTELIRKLKLQKKIGFLSTGGGAMLTYLGGGAMPGIEALQ